MNKNVLIALLDAGKLDVRAERNKRSDKKIWEIVLEELGGHYVLEPGNSGGGASGNRSFGTLPELAPTIEVAAKRLQQLKIVEGFHRYDELKQLGEPEINSRYIALIRLRQKREQQEYISKWRLGADFRHWLKMPYWNCLEGAALIHGLDPKKISAHKQNYQDLSKTHFPVVQSWVECEEIVLRCTKVGQLEAESTPIEFLRWAESVGYQLPEGLLGFHRESEKIATPAIDDEVVPTTETTVIQQLSWEANARALGEEVLKANKRLSIEQISERVRVRMVEENEKGVLGMTGRGGRVVSAESIKRHALTGLKS